jgi:hypothetical protein
LLPIGNHLQQQISDDLLAVWARFIRPGSCHTRPIRHAATISRTPSFYTCRNRGNSPSHPLQRIVMKSLWFNNS